MRTTVPMPNGFAEISVDTIHPRRISAIVFVEDLPLNDIRTRMPRAK